LHLLPCYGATPVNERVVTDGNLVFAAGVTWVIDGALQVADDLRGVITWYQPFSRSMRCALLTGSQLDDTPRTNVDHVYKELRVKSTFATINNVVWK
jgi:hypothetical protein